jgi:hypothetical protein
MSRPARYISHDGHNLTVAEWAKRCHLSRSALDRRLNKMGLARALESAEHPSTATPEQPMAETPEEQKQRRVDLPSAPIEPPPLVTGKRVRVYHKHRTTMTLSDCKIGPFEEMDILESDYHHPVVAARVIKVSA